jgi:hypothetical protein
LNWNLWLRQGHRWLSIAFTLAVVANFVALARDYRALWVGLLALVPLALLLASGLYLFLLPHATRWRIARQAGPAARRGGGQAA